MEGGLAFAVVLGFNAGGEVDGFASGYAEVGGDDFVDNAAACVFSNQLKNEVSGLIAGFGTGHSQGPAGALVIAIPA